METVDPVGEHHLEAALQGHLVLLRHPGGVHPTEDQPHADRAKRWQQGVTLWEDHEVTGLQQSLHSTGLLCYLNSLQRGEHLCTKIPAPPDPPRN